TCSAGAPTSSVRSTTACCPMARLMPLRTTCLKPGIIDAAPDHLLEARDHCGDLVCAHRKQRHSVGALLAAHDGPSQAALGMLDRDTHSRYQCPRGILHGPQNGCR